MTPKQKKIYKDIHKIFDEIYRIPIVSKKMDNLIKLLVNYIVTEFKPKRPKDYDNKEEVFDVNIEDTKT